MTETTRFTMALSVALVISLAAVTAAVASPPGMGSIQDRHHFLYDSAIPNSTEVPYGATGEAYGCLSCHAVEAISGIYRFLVERRCQNCHEPDRHHRLYGAVVSHPTDAPFAETGDLYGCLACHEVHESAGVVSFLVERDCRVCHQPTAATTVRVDIKPGSKRNVVNVRSKGKLAVAILGSDDYDVNQIDVSSLRLEGEVAPVRWRFRRRANGHTDLRLKFSNPAVQEALGELAPGQTYRVCITGKFEDGTRLTGSDFITTRPRRRCERF